MQAPGTARLIFSGVIRICLIQFPIRGRTNAARCAKVGSDCENPSRPLHNTTAAAATAS